MNNKPVLVAVDGSADSGRALRWAADYARMSDAPLHALLVWDLPPSYGMPARYDDIDFAARAESTLAESVAAALGADADVTRRIARGHTATILIDASAHVRLLVVGSHGHGRFPASHLGSVAKHCVEHARCPVVVVRGDLDPSAAGEGAASGTVPQRAGSSP